MVALHLQSEITPLPFAELGRPTALFHQGGDRPLAIASELPSIDWPGRAIYEGHRLRHRVSLYEPGLARRIAVLDEARFPINDVALHPTEPVAAVGTGSYDGGYLFEGELLLWHWPSGRCRRLFRSSREVLRCRFDEGDRLAVLLRPVHEQEFVDDEDDDDGDDDAFTQCVGTTLWRVLASMYDDSHFHDDALEGLEPISPQALGFEHGGRSPEAQRAGVLALLSTQPGFEVRARVWDVAWRSEDEIAVVHDDCHVELWSTDGTRTRRHAGPGHGIQLLSTPQGPYVHVLQPVEPAPIEGEGWRALRGPTSVGSALLRLTETGLEPVHRWAYPVLLSADASGRILARVVARREHPDAPDRLLPLDGTPVELGVLGHYDCFNHYLRLDGGAQPYWLRGTPPSSHEHKRLCRLGADGREEPLMAWDSEPRHLMGSVACFGPGESLIRAFRIHHPHPGRGRKVVERVDPRTGDVAWSSEIAALVTALAPVGEGRHVVAALLDGTVGVIDTETGTIETEAAVASDGLPTMITALAVRGRKVLAGTIDGRLLLYSLGR